jgi:hypothetical protein
MAVKNTGLNAKQHLCKKQPVGPPAKDLQWSVSAGSTCCFPKGSMPSFLLETKMAVL